MLIDQNATPKGLLGRGEQEAFYLARAIIQERNLRFTDEEMIDRLKALAKDREALSAALIDTTEGMPASASYRTRFGSLIRAYRLAGFEPDRDDGYIEINRNLREMYPNLLNSVIRKLEEVGATVSQESTTDLLLINGEYSASMVLSRCRETPAGSLRWFVRMDRKITPDITMRRSQDPHDPRRAHSGA
jgi:hypothetical protein